MHAHLAHAWQTSRLESEEELHPRGADDHTHDTAAQREHERLGEKLPHESATAGAEGETQRQLALTRCHPGDEQVHDIGAPDEQQTSRRGEQQHQRRTHVADDLLAQRYEVRVEHPRLVAVQLLETLGDRARLPARLGQRHPVAQAPDDLPIMRGAEGRGARALARHPQVDARRKVDRCRHHADDAQRLVADPEARA